MKLGAADRGFEFPVTRKDALTRRTSRTSLSLEKRRNDEPRGRRNPLTIVADFDRMVCVLL